MTMTAMLPNRRPSALRGLLSSGSKAGSLDALWFDALNSLIVDAIVDRDVDTLREGSDGPEVRRLLRAVDGEQGARFLEARNIVRRALERLAPTIAASKVEAGSHAHRMLAVVQVSPGIDNTGIAEALNIDKTEVWRTGQTLQNAGLASVRRFGRANSWELTPRGADTLKLLGWPEGLPTKRKERPARPKAETAEVEAFKEEAAKTFEDFGATVAQRVRTLMARLNDEPVDHLVVPRQIKLWVDCGHSGRVDALYRVDGRMNRNVTVDVFDDHSVAVNLFNAISIPDGRPSRR